MSDATRERMEAILVFLLPFCVYLILPAATINGDGLAYYDVVRSSDWGSKLQPGHLLYCPLMTVLVRGTEALSLPLSAARLMLLVNQLAGASSVLLVFLVARRLGMDRFARWLAALGLAVSFGFWNQAIDIETYALTLSCVTASLYAMARLATGGCLGWVFALGVLNGLAGLFHLAAIPLGLASVCLLMWTRNEVPPRALRDVALYLLGAFVAFGVPSLYVGFAVLKMPSFGSFLGWLLSSAHPWGASFNLMSFPRAVYGFVRTFLFLGYFWQASKRLLVVKGSALLFAAGWLAWQWRNRQGSLPSAARVVLVCMLAFAVPQAMLGVYFFGSDPERWVMLAPWIWLALAGLVSQLRPTPRLVAVVGVGLLALVNLVEGVWPLATDRAIEARVRAFDRLLNDNELVIVPGFDWSQYHHHYCPDSPTLQTAELIDLAVEHEQDPQGLFADLARRIDQARKDRREVLLIRILDPDENPQQNPYQELRALGHSREEIRNWLGRYQWEAVPLDDPVRTPVYRLVGDSAPRP